MKNLQKSGSIIAALLMFIFFSMSYNLFSQGLENKLLIPVGTRTPGMNYIRNTLDFNDGIKIVNIENNFKNYFERRNPKDTLKNRIKSMRLSSTGDSYLLYLELENYDYKIKISCYNMLGKKLFDAYEGLPYRDPEYYYEIPISNLPKGVYICIVQGRNFKIAEKFIVNK